MSSINNNERNKYAKNNDEVSTRSLQVEKVRRNFNPLIEEQELLVKQYRAEATEKIVGKLAKKMGADKNTRRV